MDKRVRGFLLALPLLALAACGLPEDAKKEAGEIPKTIEQAEGFVGERIKALTDALEAEPEFKVYAERERWAGKLSEASAQLKRAKELVSQEVDPILKRNKREDAQKLKTQIERVKGVIGSGRESARFPGTRLTFLRNARDEADTLIAEAARLHASIADDNRAASALVARYQAAYPARRDDIAARTAHAGLVHAESAQAASDIVAQAAAKKAGSFDYAVLADGHALLAKNRPAMQEALQRVEKVLSGLAMSYSKVLIDMKDEYFACVSRTSWQESEAIEFPKETSFDYDCKLVSDEGYETAADYDDVDAEFAAHEKGFFGGWSTKFYRTSDTTEEDAKKLWEELALDPRSSWPEYDNSSTFWIRSAEARFYHRYAYVRDGVRTDGEWEQVGPEEFQKHENHLGMALLEKPSGMFEDEVTTTPSPAGMSLVGDSKAGRWEARGGTHVWIWGSPFNTYGGFYGPGWGGYTRDEWDDWNRSRREGKPYTGSGSEPKYGTAGSVTRASTVASRSDFGKRGGFADTASVRGAGPSGRAGGPGGSGK